MNKIVFILLIIFALLIGYNMYGVWIVGADMVPFFIDPEMMLQSLYTRGGTTLLGGVAAPGGNILSLPYMPIISLIQQIYPSGGIYWVIIGVLSACGCYKFFHYLSKGNIAISTVLTIFFVFSLSYNYLFLRGLLFTQMIVTLFFWVAYLLCRYNETGSKRYFLTVLIVGVFWCVVASNPGYYIPTMLMLAGVVLWYGLVHERFSWTRYVAGLFALSIPALISVSSFLIFSQYNKSILEDDWNTRILTQIPLQAQKRDSNLTQTLRGFHGDLWATWGYDEYGQDYHPFTGYQWYQSPRMQLVSWTIIIMMIGGIFVVRGVYRRSYMIWLAIFLAGLLLYKSAAAPFGQLFEWAMTNIGVFGIFRSPHQKFGIVFVVAQMILIYCILHHYLIVKQDKRYGASMIIAVGLYSLLMGYFWFTGNLIPQVNKVDYIPLSYLRSANWINNNPTIQRTAVLPYNESTWLNTNFNYEGYSLFYYLLSDKQLRNRNDIAFGSYNKLYMDKRGPIFADLNSHMATGTLIQAMTGLHIDTIIYDEYVDRYPRFHHQENHTGTLTYLKQQGLELVNTFDKISIWSLPTQFKTSKLQFGSGDFIKISPVEYHISLSALSGTQALVFLESFHPEWKLYSKNSFGRQGLFQEPLFEQTHHLTGEYANSWIVDTEMLKQYIPADQWNYNDDGTIRLELVLYFRPQQYFLISLLITGLLFGLFLCYGLVGVVGDYRRSKSLVQN